MTAIFPLLNKLIPTGLALKGLSKLDPRIKKFATAAATYGYGTDKIMDYLRSQFESPGQNAEENQLQRGAQQGTIRPDEQLRLNDMQQKKSSALPVVGGLLGGGLELLGGQGNQQQPMQGDIGQQEQQQEPQQQKDPFSYIYAYDSKMAEDLKSRIDGGMSPQEAATIIKGIPDYAEAIKNFERENKTDFIKAIVEMFGGSMQGQQMQQPQRRTQNQDMTMAQYMQQQGGQPQQSGQGKQDLLNSMRQMTQLMSQLKGK